MEIGDRVYIKIIDEVPDGDGSYIFSDWVTILEMRDEYLIFKETDLIGKKSEVVRISKSENDTVENTNC